ncbi:beta-galactosidase [Paenibacillus cellulosilyticus]|uniref:Beta-galactosidase n=1 Tax=Paenibacillus cellulosilyticus TaxID=375489 RepID=A0A2V2YS09_9BACL|nr:beta-galactosidase [Paenibacillus cellulosilyticus]PWW00889.1 beta-galactosidase [Paenibacillus cellulosilyticus]QKS47547.1 beta-galactosidase [Paenibacillus cellulosilyticus]
MEKALHSRDVLLGVCYYPEHWPETMWEDDFRRMKELGLEYVRMAEFGWALMEPEEGVFDFSLFDRAFALAHRHGLNIIIGTPTATPPAWLTHRYPETLNAQANGISYEHGSRRHYTYNSPKFRELSARIVQRMAEHFAEHPGIVGWQLDNEFNCEVFEFYSAADHTAFREWLKAKYGSLAALNEAWGTVFWSQTYTDWEQVHLTRNVPSDSPNPHLKLDEKRFFSDSVISYAQMQADIVRAAAPRHWVTTNGLFGHLDTHKLTNDMLDFISYDSYPMFGRMFPDGGENPLLDRRFSMSLSNVRSISPNFCIMEQQSGPGGWVNRIEQPSPKPGQLRLWTYQSIAHGADLVVYFRWRTATFGTEMYWHGLHNWDNRPNRRTREVERIAEELRRAGQAIAGSRYEAEVAILRDYDNEWDGEFDKWHGGYEWTSTLSWFKRLQRRHIPNDMLFVNEQTTLDQLNRYQTLIYPHPTIIREETAKLLEAYVQGGGTLIIGCRSGYKDETGRCRMTPMPGPLAPLCGVTVEDFTREEPDGSSPSFTLSSQAFDTFATFTSNGFAETLAVTSPDAIVLGRYDNSSYMFGEPALVENSSGEGRTIYFGGVFSDPLVDQLIDRLGITSPASDLLELPECIELTVRSHDKPIFEGQDSGLRIHFLLNYSGQSASIKVRCGATDLLTGKRYVKGAAELDPYAALALVFDE